MRENILDRIESVLDSRVRPALSEHCGGVEILEYQDGILKIRMLGQCSDCPSAAITNEELIEKEVREALPEVRRVCLVTGVSENLLSTARFLLSHRDRRNAG
ncbi:NifU family protein [Caproiciproducens sp. NJN-50]|uniref:NifU family protein n=1 Tax=Acutalibacteraceae TaxID=3082771 RepID=UPI000FFE07A1|nr:MULTISPECIES: NifU family protein [Acutalibacteraceae]QAT49477.1 NifU family protein [Caproiciproducens sp. NJN-50]